MNSFGKIFQRNPLTDIQLQLPYQTPEKFRIKISKDRFPNDFFRQKKVKSSLADRYKSQQYYQVPCGMYSSIRKQRRSVKKSLCLNQFDENNQNLLFQVISSAREARDKFRAESVELAKLNENRHKRLELPPLSKGSNLRLCA